MIREFFKFELREQIRSPLLWLLSGLFGLIAFIGASSDAVQIGGAIGNVYRNAPTVTVQFMVILSIFGMLIIGVFISNALLRDFELGTADLIFSNPIKKRDFLIGRFAAAFLASAIVYIIIAMCIFVAQFMPWIDPQRLGPVSIQPQLWGFFVLVLPNVFFTGAVLAFMAGWYARARTVVVAVSNPDPEKISAYECGFNSFDDARMKFDVRFYLVSILFIIFDLEVAFLFPWAVAFGDISMAAFWSMMLFLAVLTIGFAYEWKKGALEWE